MEQIRHGRDTWAQFDNEDDNKPSKNQNHNFSVVPNTVAKFGPVWASEVMIDSSNSVKPRDVQSGVIPVHSRLRNDQFPTNWNQAPVDGYSHDQSFGANVSYPISTVHSTPIIPDPWAVTSEQKAYYLAQFLRLQPDPRSKLDGLQSKTFFELSHLPVDELSRIWELADVDQDGQLTLGEFCAAMHLVVLRRNGVPIPHSLPQALVELITANPISSATLPPSRPNKFKSKLEKQTSEPIPPSPTGPSNSPEPSRIQSPTPDQVQLSEDPNHCDHLIHKANSSCPHNSTEPKQRRWSISSQSDVCSLAEGMLVFESRPNLDAQLKHPIPLRVRALPRNNVETTLDYSKTLLDKCGNVPSQSYQIPTAFPIDSPMITDQSPSDQRFNRLGSDTTPMNSNLYYKSPSHKKSAPAALSPPPPPPRAHLNCDSVPGNLKPVIYKNQNVATPTNGVVQDHYLQKPTSLRKSSYDFVEQRLDKEKVAELQHQCDAVTQINEQLSNELMKLQKDRIALKIMLERLMPLDAA